MSNQGEKPKLPSLQDIFRQMIYSGAKETGSFPSFAFRYRGFGGDPAEMKMSFRFVPPERVDLDVDGGSDITFMCVISLEKGLRCFVGYNASRKQVGFCGSNPSEALRELGCYLRRHGLCTEFGIKVYSEDDDRE
jgi:hypothetical protein